MNVILVSNKFIQAAVVDESDVSLWWKIGNIATKTLNMRLSRYAFEKVNYIILLLKA